MTARSLLKTLQTEFPVFRESQPLSIGIDKQLLAQRPDLDRKILRVALGIHTNSLRYLKATAVMSRPVSDRLTQAIRG